MKVQLKPNVQVRHIRNITFELCAWGWGNVETFGPRFGHLWRTSQDITDTWQGMLWNIDINDEARYRAQGVQVRQDSQYTSSSKVLPFYLGKWGPFTCSLYMVTFQVIAPHLPRQV